MKRSRCEDCFEAAKKATGPGGCSDCFVIGNAKQILEIRRRQDGAPFEPFEGGFPGDRYDFCRALLNRAHQTGRGAWGRYNMVDSYAQPWSDPADHRAWCALQISRRVSMLRMASLMEAFMAGCAASSLGKKPVLAWSQWLKEGVR